MYMFTYNITVSKLNVKKSDCSQVVQNIGKLFSCKLSIFIFIKQENILLQVCYLLCKLNLPFVIWVRLGKFQFLFDKILLDIKNVIQLQFI